VAILLLISSPVFSSHFTCCMSICSSFLSLQLFLEVKNGNPVDALINKFEPTEPVQSSITMLTLNLEQKQDLHRFEECVIGCRKTNILNTDAGIHLL